MLKITQDTAFGEIKNADEFSDISKFLMVQSPGEAERTDRFTFAQACGSKAGFITDAMCWLQDEIGEFGTISYDIWDKQEKAADPSKKLTNLFFFPGRPYGPYVIVCAGGAYVSVCNVLEAFPAAKELTGLGYNVFALTYRVAQSPLLPKPQEDLAQAVRFIEANADAFRVRPGDYAVCGFSAGGHLAASFGTGSIGYKAYGVPRPGALFLGYAASTVRVFDLSLPVAQGYVTTMIGSDWSEERLDYASVDRNMDGDYPPVYAIHCMDDDTVPYKSLQVLGERLGELGIPNRLETVHNCGHGFATGFGESEGWLKRAAAFWEEIRHE